MKKVKFGLKPGDRIGNYRVVETEGCGYTAEAYLVKEIPTSVKRILKLYDRFDDNQQIKNLHDFAHYCRVLEELSKVRLLPRYYHMGHTFLRDGDGIGFYYMVQEYLDGSKFSKEMCSEGMVHEFRGKISRINTELGYGVGDIVKDNILIVNQEIRMVDCDYGRFNKPNQDIAVDAKAINKLFNSIFGV